MIDKITEQHLTILAIQARVQNVTVLDLIDFRRWHQSHLRIQGTDKQKQLVTSNSKQHLLPSSPATVLRIHQVSCNWR
ncbi:MAG TPA: hypothetical protein DCL61_26415 [Cyanobacteria bacterium UBA12227]|nr:hypothetical protein [Cyanobacteria bacterium UBA12227]HAX89966.1 hypothetical protein [Cyanobacteria bacterium UBA11370]HBY80743.1 hypothetical protein [Cyanobacteria bacterium UBA11148]